MGADPLSPVSRLRLPHFVGLGTQKGGTTSLHGLLAEHPQVCMPACKEVHYFSLHDDRSPRWYAAHYSHWRTGQLRGDITPYYLHHPRAPQHLQALLPRARLIVLLRDPVERALSQVFHARRLGFEPLELEQALAAEEQRLCGAEQRLSAPGSRDFSHQKHSYLSRSRYDQQLPRYEALFASGQLLVLRSEDLFQASEATWLRIQRFLGLPLVPLQGAMKRENASRGEALAVSAELRDRLRAALAPTAAAVKARYGFDWGW